MTAIAVREDTGPAIIPQAAAGLVEWAHAAHAAHTLAESLVKTSFVPEIFRGKPGEATAAILAGAEVGLSPMAALGAFDVIQGRATPKAITLRAIAQANGCEIVVDESTPQRCEMRGRRPGQEWQGVTWEISRARDLGLLNKPNWKQQPTAMLVARATSELCRLIAADAILGIPYSSEEWEDQLPEPTAPVQRASRRVQRRARPEPPEPELDDAEPVSSPPETPVAESPPDDEPPITDAQSKKLHALLRENSMDRDTGLAYISDVLDRTVTTTKELSKADASRVIDALDPEPTIPEPDLGES